ncbi:phage N-6-adenine-methyltransferase [Luteimonas fraxinea]|uniref:Phage N-6-adenine-methyltransferase n=1 Tax=Luteimonas fraxinea TaxID=2901869 RepID=A0ABS8UD84_9GAMM|nr:phage N-6-adenine-methyltransferase [Luteimonas fraxinea]MCD9096701.1 phage N-6-adenine-methyltransferase [Luteimonas fraxinea]MCD9126070.1 phage N-6-adenine-methyltransferase [Luteimonas fraxinea]
MHLKSNVVPLRRSKSRRPETKPKPERPELPPYYKAVVAPASSVEWFTRPAVVRALGGKSGFDVDPCTPEDATLLPMRTARRLIPPSEDGLTSLWPDGAFVWMNPPYGRQIGLWLGKLANHPGGGIALVPAHMDPAWMHDFVLNHPAVSAIALTRGRLRFVRPTGELGPSNTTGSVFVAYGPRAARNLKTACDGGVIQGKFLDFARVTGGFGGDVANDDVSGEEKAHG